MDLRQQQEDGRREQLRAMKERQAAQADQRRKLVRSLAKP